jgi:hypothetical protein
MRRLLLVLVLMFAAGCTRQPSDTSAVAKSDVDLAQQLLTRLAAHDFDAVENYADPAVRGPAFRLRVQQISKVFPPEPPTSVKLVASQSLRTGDSTLVVTTFEYEYPPRMWLLAEVALQNTGDRHVLKSVQVRPMKESLAHLNRFTFAGKGLWHYVFFAAVLAVPLFMLYTLLLVARAPRLIGKWFWAILVLIGVGQVSLNWTTNAFTVSLMNLHLLGSGFSKPNPVSPLILITAIPLGAILFYVMRATSLNLWLEEEQGTVSGKEERVYGEGEMGHGQGAMRDGGTTEPEKREE